MCKTFPNTGIIPYLCIVFEIQDIMQIVFEDNTHYGNKK